ncbi:MAG: ABC transporter ATP-binding protein [Eubacteriales bacterium]|nr:ABC transporter ATP-binding protein [Eubacteriales bacterium]
MGNEKVTSEYLLHIDKIRTVLSTRRGDLVPVEDVEVCIPEKTTVGLVGESGCGKSMTAMSVMDLLPKNGRVAQGHIFFKGEDLLKKTEEERRDISGNKISIIFQEPMTSLNPVMTVGKQVMEAITLHNKVSRKDAKERVIDIFRAVGIPEPERRFKAYPHQLSGGLRQRVMIGMAMVCRPDLLIADEPTTALDVTIEAQILNLMRQLQSEEGTSILMITHNLGVVAEICDFVYVMYAGQVVESADVFELFKNTFHPYTQGLVAAMPSTESSERLYNIPGNVPPLGAFPDGCRFHPRCEKAFGRCSQESPPLYDTGNGHQVRCFLYDSEVEA